MARTKQVARKSSQAAQELARQPPKRKSEFLDDAENNTGSSSSSGIAIPPPKSLKTICIPYEREESSENSLGSLSELPNEMWQNILSFLVGDFELYKKIDITKIDPSVGVTSRNRYQRQELSSDIASFLIPFENLVALIKLMQTNKELNRMLTFKRDGVHLTDFEMFWLNGYNFFEKLFYWIRTRSLEQIKLGTGDLSRSAVEEMGKIQNIVQHFERGKSLDDLNVTIDHDSWYEDEYASDYDEQVDEDEEEDDNATPVEKDGDVVDKNKVLEGVVIVISGIANPERTTLRETALKMGAQYRPQFTSDTTHVIAAIANTDKSNQALSNGAFVLKKEWIYDCDTNSRRMNEKTYSFFDAPKPPKKKKGPKKKTPIFNDPEASRNAILERLQALELPLENYCDQYRGYTSAFELFIFRSLMLSLNMFDALDSENRQEYWSDQSEVLLGHHYLEYYSENSIPEPNLWNRKVPYDPNVKYPKVGIVVNKPLGWTKLLCTHINQNSELKLEDVDFELLRNRLSKIILLQLSHISNFRPLENYTFPENIMFLSVEHGNNSKEFQEPVSFSGIKFSGVRYLRIRYHEEDFYNYGRRLGLKISETSFLRSFLNKETLPNLEHLVLNGFTCTTVLEEQFEFLKQLISIEIVVNPDGSRDDRDMWENLSAFTAKLSRASSKLRYVVVQTELDSRRNFHHTKLVKFYKSHQCPVSVGYASISRFYYISGE